MSKFTSGNSCYVSILFNINSDSCFSNGSASKNHAEWLVKNLKYIEIPPMKSSSNAKDNIKNKNMLICILGAWTLTY